MFLFDFPPAVSLPFPLDRQVILLYQCTDSLLETGPNRCKVITYLGEIVMFCLLLLFLSVIFCESVPAKVPLLLFIFWAGNPSRRFLCLYTSLFCLYRPGSVRLDTRRLNDTSLLNPERKQSSRKRKEKGGKIS